MSHRLTRVRLGIVARLLDVRSDMTATPSVITSRAELSDQPWGWSGGLGKGFRVAGLIEPVLLLLPHVSVAQDLVAIGGETLTLFTPL